VRQDVGGDDGDRDAGEPGLRPGDHLGQVDQGHRRPGLGEHTAVGPQASADVDDRPVRRQGGHPRQVGPGSPGEHVERHEEGPRLVGLGDQPLPPRGEPGLSGPHRLRQVEPEAGEEALLVDDVAEVAARSQLGGEAGGEVPAGDTGRQPDGLDRRQQPGQSGFGDVERGGELRRAAWLGGRQHVEQAEPGGGGHHRSRLVPGEHGDELVDGLDHGHLRSER
jgi:hypothetical protein